MTAKYFSHLLPPNGQDLQVQIAAQANRETDEKLRDADLSQNTAQKHFIIETITNEIYLTFTNPRNNKQIAQVPIAFEAGKVLNVLDPGDDDFLTQLQKDIKPLQTVVTQWSLDPRWSFKRDMPGHYTPVWNEPPSL